MGVVSQLHSHWPGLCAEALVARDWGFKPRKLLCLTNEKEKEPASCRGTSKVQALPSLPLPAAVQAHTAIATSKPQ
jgi:hypothetical protein